MEHLQLALLTTDYISRLFQFEVENRAYFARIGLPRSNDYYTLSSFSQIVSDLVAEQERDLLYMYLALDGQGTIVGRVNFTDVVRGSFQKAELGYRIGEHHQGKGYATAAVRLALEQACSVHKLHRIEAGTAPENMSSQLVLSRQGFRLVGTYYQHMRQGSQWTDTVLFEKILTL